MAEKIIYRASSLGNCVRALVADKLGHEEVRKQEHTDLLDRSAREGNLHEGWVKEWLSNTRGYRVVREQEEIEKIVMPNVVIQGHVDGVIVGMNHPVGSILEVKSMSTKQFAKWNRHRWVQFPRYAYQISFYMIAMGLPAFYVVKRREDGHLHEMEITEPPVPWQDMKNKVLRAERHRRKAQYPPCDANQQWGCPFFYLHEEAEIVSVDADEEITEALGELVLSYLSLQEQEKVGEAAGKHRKEKINGDILNLMGENDQVTVSIGGKKFRVTKSRASGVSFDKAALIADMGQDVVEKYEKAWSSPYPLIKEVKEK